MALAVAAVGATAVLLAGFLLPVYSSVGGSSSGAVVSGSDTLVGVNGPAVAWVLAVPLLATAVVAGALWWRARPLAWTVTALLAAFNLAALLSVGLLIVPVTVALVAACALHRPTRAA